MKKQQLWITVPVTTAVLLALAGCGGPDSNAASSENSSSPTTTVGEQTEIGSGGADFSNENETGTKENTGTSLGAAILSNTADAFKVNFYATTKSVPVNDQSLTASESKIPVLASYEVQTYKDSNQSEIFPETDLNDIPADMLWIWDMASKA
jgi:hypothetical protein